MPFSWFIFRSCEDFSLRSSTIGDQLEPTCSITGELFKIREFTVTLDNGLTQTFMPDITPDGVSPPRALTFNSTTFTFSRLSAQDSSPLISRMTISSVSEGLNGVHVSCEDVAASESATTTIRYATRIFMFIPVIITVVKTIIHYTLLFHRL